jgi:uncharacterized membrane protein
MSEQETVVAEKQPRRGALLWSLALNVFLICVIGAYFAAHALHKPASVGPGGPARQFEALAARLPADDATALRAEFSKQAAAIDEAHKAAHRTRDAVRAALGADPYNEGAVRQAMSEAEAVHVRLNKLLQDAIASAAAKMTPAGRIKLADWQPGPPRPKGEGRH